MTDQVSIPAHERVAAEEELPPILSPCIHSAPIPHERLFSETSDSFEEATAVAGAGTGAVASLEAAAGGGGSTDADDVNDVVILKPTPPEDLPFDTLKVGGGEPVVVTLTPEEAAPEIDRDLTHQTEEEGQAVEELAGEKVDPVQSAEADVVETYSSSGSSDADVTPDDENSEDKFEDAQETLSPHRTRSEAPAPTTTSSPPPSPTPSPSYVNTEAWKLQRKHMFILSDAGKPIYSLHGDEDELASLMAVMQAMSSYVTQEMNDTLRSFNVAGKHIVFVNKGPLILVAVSRGMESVTQLIVQLTYLYNQLLSVLTLSQLTRIFDQRKGFDLRRMIAGSERLLDSLCYNMDRDPSFMLSSVRVLPMPASSARDLISQTISQACNKIKNLVFAILVADNKLITLVRMKKYFIHPADLHLILNLVSSTESFKHSETWTPICLPKFDSSGFMHAHVSYLTDNSPACLVMLTVERDIFFELSEAKKKILENLKKSNALRFIEEGLEKSRYTPSSIGIPELRHFLYKAKEAAQFTSPQLCGAYGHEEARVRLHGQYLQLQNRLHSLSRPLKLVYSAAEHENVLGWVTQTFELYAAFSPATTKTTAINAINKVLKWCKRDESSLFILNAPTF